MTTPDGHADHDGIGAVDRLTKKTPFVEAGPNDKPPT
jgi:hypothetical protein